MCWVKPQEEAGNQYIFSNKRTSSSSNFSLRIHSDNGIKFNGIIYTGSTLGSTLTSTTTITAGTWYHVAITAKANEQKIYINGQLEHTVTLGFGMAPSATDESTIGSFGSSLEYEGLISELAIFNAYLTGESVLAAYNSGFDLKTNVGDYTNSSDITHYYKMGNGLFDDKANGIVHDQVNPGFGINLWNGANGDVTSWAPFGGNTVEEDDGTLKFTYEDNSNGPYIYLRDAHHLSADLVVGATYELSITTKVNTGSVAWRLQHNSYPTYSFPSLTSTDFVTQSETFIATTAASHYLFVAAFGTGEIVWVKDITVRKLNGNPGLTSGGPTFSSDTP